MKKGRKSYFLLESTGSDAEYEKEVKPEEIKLAPDEERMFEHESLMNAVSPLFNSDSVLENLKRRVGGDITYDVIKWKEKGMAISEAEGARAKIMSISTRTSMHIRKMSDPTGLRNLNPNLAVPGGFRRHFVVNNSFEKLEESQKLRFIPESKSGRESQLSYTNNFLYFLANYGESLNLIVDEIPECDEDDGFEMNPSDVESRRSPSENKNYPTLSLNSNSKTYFTLMKSFIGSGILLLPRAFYNGGMAFSIVLLIVFGFVSLFGMLRLVKARRVYNCLGFADLGYTSMQRHFGRGGDGMKIAVEITLMASQFGFCAAGSSFVSNTVRVVFQHWSNTSIPFELLFIFQLFFYIPFSLMRKIQKLSPLAILADLFILFGFSILIWFNVHALGEEGAMKVKAFNEKDFALFFGTIVYAFEGIGLILPIEGAMQTPKDFPRVLTYAIITTAGFMLIIAGTSYLAYGSEVEILIFDNLPKIPLIYFTELLYCLAIVFTYPLMLFPGTCIIEKWILKERSGRNNQNIKWSKNIIRIMCVALITLVAYSFGSHLEILVALIGAICCGPLLFVFPAIFHWTLSEGREKIADVLLFVFGTVVTLYVAYQVIVVPLISS